MPGLTERERAKRAKMVARFNAIKHNTIMASDASAVSSLDGVTSTPKKEQRDSDDSGRLNNYSSSTKLQEVGQTVSGTGSLEENAAVSREGPSKTSAELDINQVDTLSLEYSYSVPAPEPVLKMMEQKTSTVPPQERKPSLPPINTAPTTSLSDSIPSTPTKNTPRSQSTPRSRRSTSIADAKKKLAAARKVSSSPKPNVDKTVLKEVASKIPDVDNEIMREADRNYLSKLEGRADIGKNKETSDVGEKKETLTEIKTEKTVQDTSSTLTSIDSGYGYKSYSVPSSPSSRFRSDKIAKIRARSPRFADRHKNLLSSMAPDEGREAITKRFSNEHGKATPSKLRGSGELKETKRRLNDSFGTVVQNPTKDRWSDEFIKSDGPQHADNDAPRFSNEFDASRLSYGSDTQTISDDMNARSSYGSDAKTISDELNASRLTRDSSTRRISNDSDYSGGLNASVMSNDTSRLSDYVNAEDERFKNDVSTQRKSNDLQLSVDVNTPRLSDETSRLSDYLNSTQRFSNDVSAHRQSNDSQASEYVNAQRLSDETSRLSDYLNSTQRLSNDVSRFSHDSRVSNDASRLSSDSTTQIAHDTSRFSGNLYTQRLSNDASRQSHDSNTQRLSHDTSRLSTDLNNQRWRNEIARRLSTGSDNSEVTELTQATGVTLKAKDTIARESGIVEEPESMPEPQPQPQTNKVKKTWQEQSKIAAKAKQYRKWQHYTASKKHDEPSQEESKFTEVLGSYQSSVQCSNNGLVNVERDLFEPRPSEKGRENPIMKYLQSNYGYVDRGEDLYEPEQPQEKSSEDPIQEYLKTNQGLQEREQDLFEPRPQNINDGFKYCSFDANSQTEEPEYLITPTPILGFHGYQGSLAAEEPTVANVFLDAYQPSPTRRSLDMDYAAQAQAYLSDYVEEDMNESLPDDNQTSPSRERIDKRTSTTSSSVAASTSSQYKELVPNRSDTSKSSEPSSSFETEHSKSKSTTTSQSSSKSIGKSADVAAASCSLSQYKELVTNRSDASKSSEPLSSFETEHSHSKSKSAASSQSSLSKTTGKSADTVKSKALVASKSDVSKSSGRSLNQLTISTSDVQSFLPTEEGSQSSHKLAGEVFLSTSKDTETQTRSNENDDDQFLSQFDWPMDAFSPTSWGGEANGSEDSKWDKAATDAPSSPATVEERKGWDFTTKARSVEWGEGDDEHSKTTKSPKKLERECDSSWGQTEWDDVRDPIDDEREDGTGEAVSAEAEERVQEVDESRDGAQGDGLSCIDQYEGFGEVQHADCPSRMESELADSRRESNENEFASPSIESKCSEGTMGTATEFDPISLFEGSGSFPREIESSDSFPACDMEENDATAVSWGSAKVLKANDDATSSSKAGDPVDASGKASANTPSGKESLESWWQSRYASSQNNDINAAIQEALMNQTVSREEERCDHEAAERGDSSPRCKPEFATPKQPQHQNDDVFQDPLSARTKYFPHNAMSSPDDDSIFGDLDDDSTGRPKSRNSLTNNKSKRKSSASKYGTIASNTETEDIFAGVSISQVNAQKNSNTNPFKSLLDGSTTPGSESLHKKTKSSSRDPEYCLEEMEEMEPMGLFMGDGSYGVINVKDSGKNSPSGASVTSDITTSVIFGGDFGKKRSLSRKGTSMSMDKPESIFELPDVLSDKPVCSPANSCRGTPDQGFDDDNVENVDPQHGVTAQESKDLKDASRIRSLMSQSTSDEGTEESNPSILKKALSMMKEGAAASKAKCATANGPLDSVGGGAKAAATIFALPIACGLLGASSFVYCAAKGAETCATKGGEACKTKDTDAFCATKGMGMFCATDPKHTEMNGLNEDGLAVDGASTKKMSILDELAVKDIHSDTLDETVGSNAEIEGPFGSDDASHTAGSNSKLETGGVACSATIVTEANSETIEEKSSVVEEDTVVVVEEETVADEHTLNTNERTLSTYDRTVTTYDDDDSVDDDETDYDDESDSTEQEEGHEIADIVSLSKFELLKWNDWESKDNQDCGNVLSPRSKKSLEEEQTRAYEKLLFYAYTALTVPLPAEIVEKREELDPSGSSVEYPPVLSPRGAELRCEAMKLLLTRLGEDGMEVLKLNREKKWQQRFLTITKEVVWFTKSDDIRYNKIDCCPQGLLWVKKFNGHNNEHSVSSVGKNGKGGIMFTSIKSVSVTTDHFGLSKKQKKGKFKDSFTFVLHADFDGTKRDILFRCCNKDDICTLSSGFQAIIDRIKNETVVVPKPLTSQQNKLPMTAEQVTSPLASAKPFSPKAIGSEDRWEV